MKYIFYMLLIISIIGGCKDKPVSILDKNILKTSLFPDTVKRNIDFSMKESRFVDYIILLAENNKFDFIVTYLDTFVTLNFKKYSYKIDKLKLIETLNRITSKLDVNGYMLHKYNPIPDEDRSVYLLEGYENEKVIINFVLYLDKDFNINQIDVF